MIKYSNDIKKYFSELKHLTIPELEATFDLVSNTLDTLTADKEAHDTYTDTLLLIAEVLDWKKNNLDFNTKH